MGVDDLVEGDDLMHVIITLAIVVTTSPARYPSALASVHRHGQSAAPAWHVPPRGRCGLAWEVQEGRRERSGSPLGLRRRWCRLLLVFIQPLKGLPGGRL